MVANIAVVVMVVVVMVGCARWDNVCGLRFVVGELSDDARTRERCCCDGNMSTMSQ